MKNILGLASTALALLALTACYGGGGGGYTTGTGGAYNPPNTNLTFIQKALGFEYDLIVNMRYDVKLVKTNTLQYDYIVVYDYDFKTFDAYYIGPYRPGQNISNYLSSYAYKFDFDLIPQLDGTYYSPYSGRYFEKNQFVSLDPQTAGAVKEQMKEDIIARRIASRYSLSADVASDMAATLVQFETASKSAMTSSDYDQFAVALFGFSVSEGVKALELASAGDKSAALGLVKRTSEHLNISTEQTLRIMKDTFKIGL